MKAVLNYMQGGEQQVVTRDLPCSEQGFWRGVASVLPDVDIPSVYSITTPRGDAALDITQRGTYVRGGEDRPSMFVIPLLNDIQLDSSDYEDAYLTCINPDTKGGRGNYKFYRLTQKPDGTVTAFYGRIGQSHGFGAEREIKEPMPSWMFEVRKAEKISKGYIDRSSAYCDGDSHVVGETATSASEPTDGLYQKLLAFAKQRVERSLAVGTVVTAAQVEDCGKLLNRLGRCHKVSSFNDRLLEIMTLSPRSVSSVAAELARDEGDFGRIIDREESLLAAMRAVAAADKPKRGRERRDGFASEGIEWRELADAERDDALALVPPSLREKVCRIYSVSPAAQRARFEAYLAQRGISDVRLMWHGSRNENWCSIVSRSLMLNPNAQITGKMFGQGIYFGYDGGDGGALKSWNYTSARGSYWAHGTSSTAFMGLYECAYGTPYNPSTWGSYDKAWLDSRGCDCVHVHGGACGLRHDEVVFYDEAAVCIKFLYEFEV